MGMSIGTSGRIVIEVEPGVKRQLYSALAIEGLTLKDWFLREVNTYLLDSKQPDSGIKFLDNLGGGKKLPS